MKPKDIFGLAVRLLGLYFLYLGLNALAQMLNSDVFQSPDKSDIINSLLPVVFYLAVSVALLTARWLERVAYPEPTKTSPLLSQHAKPAAPETTTAPSTDLTDMDRAEKKLASLVEKPGPNRPVT